MAGPRSPFSVLKDGRGPCAKAVLCDRAAVRSLVASIMLPGKIVE